MKDKTNQTTNISKEEKMKEMNILDHQLFIKNQKTKEVEEKILNNLTKRYEWYERHFDKDFKKIMKYFKQHWIKVAKLRLLINLRGRLSDNKIKGGIAIGPVMGISTRKDLESTVNHESIHIAQYKENSPLPFLKARLWFIRFGIINQRGKLRAMKSERKKYGKDTAAAYATKNTPMEFEAFLHEGDTKYLETREPFAYKKYETKKGRSQAIKEWLDQNIQSRIDNIDALSEKDNINFIINELYHEVKKLEEIKEKYWNDDRELVATMDAPQWSTVRAEPKKLVEKRLELLDHLLKKEKACKKILKTYPKLQIISRTKEEEHTGIIKVVAENIYTTAKQLKNEEKLKRLDPNIRIISPSGKEKQEYIAISFSK